MNRYDRFPGDYLRDTLELTMAEDGAYTRLLDWYYANERPIPHERRFSVVRASKRTEKRLTDAILLRYFRRVGNDWVHDRAERDIETAKPRIDAARSNGKLGGRPKNTKPNTKPSGKPSGLAPGNLDGKLPPPPPISPRSKERGEGAREPGRNDLESGAVATQRPLDDRTADAIAMLKALRQRNVRAANVNDPRLLAALAAGVTPAQVIALADELLERNGADNPPAFAYLLATAQGRLADAAKDPTHASSSRPARISAADTVLRNITKGRAAGPARQPDRD